MELFCGGKNKDQVYRGTVPLRVESKCAKAGDGVSAPAWYACLCALPLKCLLLSCVEILKQDWWDGRFKRYFLQLYQSLILPMSPFSSLSTSCTVFLFSPEWPVS
jgi:hypothetical protein